jgi:hypothetical protein
MGVTMINRYEVVKRHNPVLTQADLSSPLTVGNGEFAFTADITGMQTLYEEHKNAFVPLCTMSQWGWHTIPARNDRYEYTMDDLVMTEYKHEGQIEKYASLKHQGNEEVYDWLRENPHRLNLCRIGLTFDGEEIKKDNITEIYQELDLYSGILISSFQVHGVNCTVKSACHPSNDTLAFEIDCPAIQSGRLKVGFYFPYGSPDITGANWECDNKHNTKVVNSSEHRIGIRRILDRDSYFVDIRSKDCMSAKINEERPNYVQLSLTTENTPYNKIAFVTSFYREETDYVVTSSQVFRASSKHWEEFWNKGGIIDLHKSKDKRAIELERRIILSQYLLALQSSGSLPPQETGLTCNSWYGKFHLEMHLWHSAWLPLWSRGELLEKSLPWYEEHLPKAIENAKRNGYEGAKWPKMVAYSGTDSPSTIAVLLIWQQPHIIYMLELLYKNGRDKNFLKKYWKIVKLTAEYMCDLVVFDREAGTYNLTSPLIPAQEEHDPNIVKNPAFEVEYWRFALEIASNWSKRLNYSCDKWEEISSHMAMMPRSDKGYLAHDNCPQTFEKFNKDHPSMLGSYGLIASHRVDRDLMERTLDKVLKCWDYESMWGWDFAMMAMTAVRLNKPELAVDILLYDTPKNAYVISGNNFQKLRKDLPLYLPGNGSLLLAAAMMCAGYGENTEKLPGFPKDGTWEVEYEGINPFPY